MARMYMALWILPLLVAYVTAQGLPNIGGGGTTDPPEKPREANCPNMNRGRVRQFGYYILDRFNNRIYYKCNQDRTMTRMDCPPGKCAYYKNGKVRGHHGGQICNKDLSSPRCRGGYRIPRPQPLESCASQAVALGPTIPAPSQSTPCPTACVVEFSSLANILVRSCVSPMDGPVQPGCYGDPNSFKYYCDSDMCNVHPLDVIIDNCANNWI